MYCREMLTGGTSYSWEFILDNFVIEFANQCDARQKYEHKLLKSLL